MRPCPSWYLGNRNKCIAHHKHSSVTCKPTEQSTITLYYFTVKYDDYVSEMRTLTIKILTRYPSTELVFLIL